MASISKQLPLCRQDSGITQECLVDQGWRSGASGAAVAWADGGRSVIMELSLTNIVAIVGLIGAIASVGLLAWQTRAVADQAKISNRIAQASIISNSSNNLREFFLIFIEHPELRPYFYESKKPPSWGVKRTRLIVLAEMLGDIFEDGLVAHHLVPTIRSYDDWVKYCSTVLAASPILKETMELHPGWWPRLRDLTSKKPAPVANIARV
jgi:hypothetical protein